MFQEPLLTITMETNKQPVIATVYLTDDEAKQFINFQEHYDNFVILSNSKVFDQRGSAVTLHFDKFGVIRTIQRADVLYDHRSTFLNTN